MPGVGSTSYFAASTVFTLARACLNDSGIALFNDTVLLPYANSAYRKVQRGLSMSGAPLFIVDNVLIVIPLVSPVDPAVQVILNDATAPPNQLPIDLLEPVKIEERPNSSNQNFVEMVDLTEHGGLPSQTQGSTLGMWEWRTDGIYFVGATQDTQIRLRYKKAFPDLTDGTSIVLIRNAQDCIGYLTAAMAAMARGSPLADKWSQAGEDSLENLISAATRREQNTTRRRRPFSSKTGGHGSSFSRSW